jgi:sec-independent protein translocase protein TatA
MIPMVGLPSAPELLIILAVVLLLFGGSRLAGLGKSTGRAIKEFKEETKGLKGGERDPQTGIGSTTSTPYTPGTDDTYPPQQGQAPYQQGPTQPYRDPADGAPYQQPPQAGPSSPADRDR